MKVFIIEINCSCHKWQLETICQPFGIVHTLSPAFIIKVSPVAKKECHTTELANSIKNTIAIAFLSTIAIAIVKAIFQLLLLLLIRASSNY